VVDFGRYRFLPETRSIEMDGAPVELKNREYELALFLFQNMGRLLSRDHLREIVWGQTADVMSRSLDTHISRLRTLLDLRPGNGYIVTAVYGVGYRFEAVEAL
jgi:DNA-binding response OmpR family regulator